jgi:fructokinase
MRNCNSTWLNGERLREDLCARLGRDVRIANDAACFALSEATDGAAAGAGTVFGVILGTGVGGGVCVGGRLLAGPNAIAGEWGHNRFAGPRGGLPGGRPCYCGRSDCIETWLSGPGLLHTYRELGGTATVGAEVPVAAGQGERLAQAALALHAEQLAFALAQVINVLDPHVIVLGGGLSNIEGLYAEVPARWGAHVFSDVVTTRLVPARFGDSSGVRGAAWLFPLLP